ncbi:MAG: hypothetical protein QG559_921 [Campylobacterota bacterium]|nr:hypothetical protein [Campylobacterota bacterium]
MVRVISSIATAVVLLTIISGCSEPTPEEAQDIRVGECKQENSTAPKWTCVPELKGFYSAVGIAERSAAGMAYMRKVALANGRSDLAQQIQTLVKDKITIYTGTTGSAKSETVDQATETVTKQVAKVDLAGSKAIDMWTAPSGALYMLVTVSKDDANEQIRSNLRTSFKNEQALWQQFKAKNALEDLEKEFEE